MANSRPYQIDVVSLAGRRTSLDVTSGTTVANVMRQYQDKEGVPVNQQRLVWAGAQISSGDRSRTLQSLNIGEGSVIHLVLTLRDIGMFDLHIATPGVELLQTPKNWSGGELEMKEIIQKVKENKRVLRRNLKSNHFESYSSTSSRDGDDDEESSRLLLSKEECQILKDFLDRKFFEWESEQCDEGSAKKEDFQITIEEEELSTLIGEQTTRKLITFFKGPFTEIKLRRVNSHGKCINFHLDMSLRTMQVPLNSDQEYDGGRLVYLTEDHQAERTGKVEIPSRPAGSWTIHDNTIVHGVTTLASGIRYALFFLQYP